MITYKHYALGITQRPQMIENTVEFRERFKKSNAERKLLRKLKSENKRVLIAAFGKNDYKKYYNTLDNTAYIAKTLQGKLVLN